MAKLEYVKINEEAIKKSNLVVINDWGQEKSVRKLHKDDILQWDIETPTARDLKKNGVIEVVPKSEYEAWLKAKKAPEEGQEADEKAESKTKKTTKLEVKES